MLQSTGGLAAPAAGVGIVPVAIAIALLIVFGWSFRRWPGRMDRNDGIPLNWLIVSDGSGNEAFWELDGERVGHDPFCPNDLLKMARIWHGADTPLPGWRCARCAHSFRLKVAAPEGAADLIARQFNARLRRLGKPATVGVGQGQGR